MDTIQSDKPKAKIGRPKGSKDKKPRKVEPQFLAPPVRVGRLRGRPRKQRDVYISDKPDENGGILAGAKKLLRTIKGEKREVNPGLANHIQELKENAESMREPFLHAMEQHNGKPTFAAKELGLSYNTVRRWYKEDADFRNRFDDLRLARVEFVEDNLIQNIEKGKEISTIFFLKCQGKDRGWVERQEVNHTGTILHAHGHTADKEFLPRFMEILAESQGAGQVTQLPVADSERPVLPDTVCVQQDGLRERLAVSEVQGSTSGTGRDDGPVGEGTQEVNHHNICEDDSGHIGGPQHNGGDIQPYEADSQELLETDKEGA